MLKLAMLPLFATLFYSCAKAPVSATNADGSAQYINVHYGADAKQVFDVYLPANRSANSTKVLFLIHGGGWFAGDKLDFGSGIAAMQAAYPGWAIVNVNYRLASLPNNNPFPTQENDIKAAVQYIYDRREEYKISDKWVLLGASAGAHLAMLQAYKNQTPVKVKAVVNYYGPSSLNEYYDNPPTGFNRDMVALLVGGTTATAPQKYFDSSPINFVNTQTPPTIIFQGSADDVVRPSQQEALKLKLQSKNVPVDLYVYPGAGHSFGGAPLSDSFIKMGAFIQQYVQ